MSISSGDRLVLVDRCVIPSASSLISCGLFTEPDRVSGRLQRMFSRRPSRSRFESVPVEKMTGFNTQSSGDLTDSVRSWLTPIFQHSK